MVQLDVCKMSTDAEIKAEIMKHKDISMLLINVVLNFYKGQSVDDSLLRRKIGSAAQLFNENVLEKIDERIMSKFDKYLFHSAFITLFAQSDVIYKGFPPSHYAPTFNGKQIGIWFSNRISVFDQIIEEWDEAKGKADEQNH